MEKMTPLKMLRQMEFISDPGHGWLKVPKKIFLQEYSVASVCSYSNFNFIFLEEDCDLPNFLDPFIKKYKLEQKDIYRNVRETCDTEYSYIRKLPRWSGNFGIE